MIRKFTIFCKLNLIRLSALQLFEQFMDNFRIEAVSYTHLRAHETVLDLVCRLLLEKKKTKTI